VLSKIEKLKERLLRKPTDMRFSDVEYLLEYYGFKYRRSGSTHVVVRHPTGQTITIVVHDNCVKHGYLVQLIKLLNMEETDNV
jgi:predicted RNA binding protein YcfA (HicA-like mRNA interferase family)